MEPIVLIQWRSFQWRQRSRPAPPPFQPPSAAAFLFFRRALFSLFYLSACLFLSVYPAIDLFCLSTGLSVFGGESRAFSSFSLFFLSVSLSPNLSANLPSIHLSIYVGGGRRGRIGQGEQRGGADSAAPLFGRYGSRLSTLRPLQLVSSLCRPLAGFRSRDTWDASCDPSPPPTFRQKRREECRERERARRRRRAEVKKGMCGGALDFER